MIKTISFAIIHMSVAFSVGYLMTGDIMVGSALALVEPMVNTIAYFFHEKAWQHQAQIRSYIARRRTSAIPSGQNRAVIA